MAVEPTRDVRWMLAVAGAVGLIAPAAHAQSDARRELVQRGVAARDAGDHATALALFEQAGVIEMRPGLRLSIAQEQQSLGRMLPACESASRCVADLQASLGSPESARILPACAEIAAQACRGFARVRVTLARTLPAGTELRVQDRAVPVTNGEATTFVAAGTVRVALLRDGRESQARVVDAVAGAVSTVALAEEPTPVATTTAPSGASPEVPAAAPRVEPVAPTPHPATPAPTTSRSSVTAQWWFWTAISAVVVGGVLGGMAAGGVFDHTAPPPTGVTYSVSALRGW
ncbi:MAG: hypothetical protein U0325_03985 [Polyangiales bacterium]